MNPKLNVTSTAFLFPLGTLSLRSCGIGMAKMVKSMTIEKPLDAYVAVFVSRQ